MFRRNQSKAVEIFSDFSTPLLGNVIVLNVKESSRGKVVFHGIIKNMPEIITTGVYRVKGGFPCKSNYDQQATKYE